MTYARIVAAVCSIAAGISMLAAVAAPMPEPAQAASPAGAMVREVNRLRARNGLRPLRLSRSLTRSSSRYARHLMRSRRFGHSSRVRASRRFRALGEVLELHWGWGAGARRAVARWRRSGYHRSVLLSRRFREIGAGLARGRFGRRRASIWVVQVGRR